jgi:hypothetical protein
MLDPANLNFRLPAQTENICHCRHKSIFSAKSCRVHSSVGIGEACSNSRQVLWTLPRLHKRLTRERRAANHRWRKQMNADCAVGVCLMPSERPFRPSPMARSSNLSSDQARQTSRDRWQHFCDQSQERRHPLALEVRKRPVLETTTSANTVTN